MRKIFLKITYLFGCATFIACSHSSVPAGKARATGSVTDASLAEYRKDSITASFGVPICLKMEIFLQTPTMKKLETLQMVR
jgi:hypothetical protein